jgi:uncharacterized protein with NRDE domain
MEEIKTKEKFINSVYELSQDFNGNHNLWENTNIGDYLEALAAWTGSMDGFYLNLGLTPPENTDWKVMANMLAAEKVKTGIYIVGENMEEIKTRKDFVSFVNGLSQDCDDPNYWENANIEDYLSALARWTDDMDGFYLNLDLIPPQNIDWKVMANMLAAEKVKTGIYIVQENIKKIETRDDFVNFAYELSQNYNDDPNSWENANLGDYLSAIAHWTNHMDGFYLNLGLKPPENIDWQVMANILAAARVYE